MTPAAIAIIQARMGSSRFPGKSMAEIDDRPILSIMMEQLSFCQMLDAVVLAVPDTTIDDPLAEYAAGQGWLVCRGNEEDVLARYHKAAVEQKAGPKTGVVRLTGDDILPDPHLVDAIVHLYAAFGGEYDYVSTDRAGRLPYGASVEILSFAALTAANEEATSSRDREHVVPFVKWNTERFRCLELTTSVDLSDSISLSIDTPEDLNRARALLSVLRERKSPPFHISDILDASSLIGDEASSGGPR